MPQQLKVKHVCCNCHKAKDVNTTRTCLYPTFTNFPIILVVC